RIDRLVEGAVAEAELLQAQVSRRFQFVAMASFELFDPFGVGIVRFLRRGGGEGQRAGHDHHAGGQGVHGGRPLPYLLTCPSFPSPPRRRLSASRSPPPAGRPEPTSARTSSALRRREP